MECFHGKSFTSIDELEKAINDYVRYYNEERGENGFGYDSLFFSPEKGCTFAELETVEKKKISHRAKALAVLKSKLSV